MSDTAHQRTARGDVATSGTRQKTVWSIKDLLLQFGMIAVLVALVILVPLLAALGFVRMVSEIGANGLPTPIGSDASLHKAVLASWGASLMKSYLCAIFLAFLFGRLHVFLIRFVKLRRRRVADAPYPRR